MLDRPDPIPRLAQRGGYARLVVLRQKQLEVLQGVYGGHNVFALFPTGYGKSLCYQLFPYMFDVKLGLTKAAPIERSVVLVISPLVNAAYFLRYIQPFIMDFTYNIRK